jgi:protein-tyrosine phosphatase
LCFKKQNKLNIRSIFSYFIEMEKIKSYILDSIENITKYLERNDGPGMTAMNRILPHIFISNLTIACDTRSLKQYKIKTILYADTNKKTTEILKTYKALGINHQLVFINENMKYEDIVQVLSKCYRIILQSVADKKNILIHCNTGISISPGIVAYYMMKRCYLLHFDSVNKIKEVAKKRIEIKKIVYPYGGKIFEIIKLIKSQRICVILSNYFLHILLLAEQTFKQNYFDNFEEFLNKTKELDSNDPEYMEDNKEDDEDDDKEDDKDSKEIEYLDETKDNSSKIDILDNDQEKDNTTKNPKKNKKKDYSKEDRQKGDKKEDPQKKDDINKVKKIEKNTKKLDKKPKDDQKIAESKKTKDDQKIVESKKPKDDKKIQNTKLSKKLKPKKSEEDVHDFIEVTDDDLLDEFGNDKNNEESIYEKEKPEPGGDNKKIEDEKKEDESDGKKDDEISDGKKEDAKDEKKEDEKDEKKEDEKDEKKEDEKKEDETSDGKIEEIYED